MRILITASGIQEYIFGIKERQASRRLRGRSSRLGLVIDLCQLLLKRYFGEIDIKRNAGSRLEVEVPLETPELNNRLEKLREELDRHSREDLDGQVWFAVAQGIPQELYEDLGARKLNLGRGILQSGTTWNEEKFLFERSTNERVLEDAVEAGKYPLPDADLGSKVVHLRDALITLRSRTSEDGRDKLFLVDYIADMHAIRLGETGKGVGLKLPEKESPGVRPLYKAMARHAPIDPADAEGKRLLDFDGIAKKSEGSRFLGVLKADLDNLGTTFQNLPSDKVGELSRSLEIFFTEDLERMLRTPRDSVHDYSFNYIVYSGGDDLFMFGPWDKLIRFADDLHDKLQSRINEWKRDQSQLNLTLSAGFKLAHPKSPVRFLAEDVEEALEQAKGHWRIPAKLPDKNRISVFERVLAWDELRKGLQLADEFIPALKEQKLSVGFLQRFQYYASQFRWYEAGHIEGLRMIPLLQNDWHRNSQGLDDTLRQRLNQVIEQLLKPMATETARSWRIMDFASRFALYAARSKE